MKRRLDHILYFSMSLVAANLCLSAPARADLLFQVQVDTTAIMNQSGYSPGIQSRQRRCDGRHGHDHQLRHRWQPLLQRSK